SAEVHGEAAVADDDGCDGRLARRSILPADVEPNPAELFFPIACVGPEVLDQLRLLLKDIERSDAGGGHARRMRRREQKRTRAVIKELDQVARAANISADSADRLGQCAYLDVDASVNIEVVNCAAAIA